jgi:hypothetical protein
VALIELAQNHVFVGKVNRESDARKIKGLQARGTARFWASGRTPQRSRVSVRPLLQFGIFGLGLLQDGNVGIGVFPKREEVLICRLGFGGVARQRVRTGQA